MRLNQNRLRELFLLGGVCGLFFFFRMSAIGLLGPDEPRYAQVAREMLARRDWITPVLYGHTWLEKPILLYWAEMLSYRLFGVNDWAARVPSALAATLLVLGTFLAVRRIRPTARLDAALMVASSLPMLGFARAAVTDMLLTAPFALGMLSWFCWYQGASRKVAEVIGVLRSAQDDTKRSAQDDTVRSTQDDSVRSSQDDSGWCGPGSRLWLVFFYAMLALAMLAKGPVAPVLAAMVLIAFCAVERNWRALWRTLDPLGIVMFLAVAAPWYVLVQMHTPEFFRVFFLQHNLARFGSNLYRHRQPFWFYVPIALVATLPWTVWLIHGLGDASRALWVKLRPSMGAASAPKQASAELHIVPVEEESSAESTGALQHADAPVEGVGGLRSAQDDTGRGEPDSAEQPDADGESVPAPGFTFEIFLLVWAAVPILFFSLSQSKLPGYILPSVPALLILAAVAVHRRAQAGLRPSLLAAGVHSTVLAAIAAGLCLAPRLVFHLPLTTVALVFAAAAGTAIFVVAALSLITSGWRMLHFVTLLPMILAVGFLLRGLAPAFDATQSSRPVALLLQQIDQPGPLPLATFGLNRNMAFGLAFYLDHPVLPYEGLEVSPAVYEIAPGVPAGEHVLVARQGSLPTLSLLLAGRRVSLIGFNRPQQIEVYLVSAAQ